MKVYFLRILAFFSLTFLCYSIDAQIHRANVPGVAQTMYSGYQNITCDDFTQGNYRLYEVRNTTQGSNAIIRTLIISVIYLNLPL